MREREICIIGVEIDHPNWEYGNMARLVDRDCWCIFWAFRALASCGVAGEFCALHWRCLRGAL
eukprot:scaffold71729_cov27-Tisochrysis_lutea.AAC.2